MTIQIFARDVSRWDIFISSATSFSSLSSLIHTQLTDADTQIQALHIYIGNNDVVQGLELVENFEILLNHSPIDCVYIVVDRVNRQFKTIDRAIRFMRDVYGYNVCIEVAQTQTIRS